MVMSTEFLQGNSLVRLLWKLQTGVPRQNPNRSYSS